MFETRVCSHHSLLFAPLPFVRTVPSVFVRFWYLYHDAFNFVFLTNFGIRISQTDLHLGCFAHWHRLIELIIQRFKFLFLWYWCETDEHERWHRMLFSCQFRPFPLIVGRNPTQHNWSPCPPPNLKKLKGKPSPWSSSSLTFKSALRESGCIIGYEPTIMSRDHFWGSISRDTNVGVPVDYPLCICRSYLVCKVCSSLFSGTFLRKPNCLTDNRWLFSRWSTSCLCTHLSNTSDIAGRILMGRQWLKLSPAPDL